MIPLLLEAAIRSLAVGAVAWLGLRLLRVNDPRLEKIIWVTVLAGASVMPWLMRIPVAHGWTVPPVVLHAVSVPGVSAVPPAHANVLLVIYLAVATILTVRLVVGLCRMLLVRHRAESVQESWVGADRIRISDRIESPATFGSTILLPVAARSWTRSQRDSILAHERAHVRHFDGYIQWLAALHACLFWFSPFAWWLRGRLADLAERISDDVALSGDTTPAEYASLLLSMASGRGAGWIAVSMARGRVAARIERILADDYRGSHANTLRPLRRSLTVLAVIPVVVLGAGAATVSATQSKPVAALASQTAAAAHTGSAKDSSKDGASGMDPNGPHIVGSLPVEELEKYYPTAALHDGIEGDVQITVTLDREGRATDTLILSETPLEMGFGAAASQLAHVFTYANPAGHPAALTYHIKFALDN